MKVVNSISSILNHLRGLKKRWGLLPVNPSDLAQAKPKTFITPYTSPATDAIVSSPQRAVSPAVQPVVFVPLTVVMNTPESTTTPSVRDMIPTIKFAM